MGVLAWVQCGTGCLDHCQCLLGHRFEDNICVCQNIVAVGIYLAPTPLRNFVVVVL